jgi:hypothetical protein
MGRGRSADEILSVEPPSATGMQNTGVGVLVTGRSFELQLGVSLSVSYKYLLVAR